MIATRMGAHARTASRVACTMRFSPRRSWAAAFSCRLRLLLLASRLMSSSRLSAVPAGSFNSPSSVDHYAIAMHLLTSKCGVQAVELSAATMHAAGTRIMQGDGQCSAQSSCQAMTAAMIPCMLTKLSAGESKHCMRLMQSRARILSTGYAGGVRPSMQHALICRHARSKRSCLC